MRLSRAHAVKHSIPILLLILVFPPVFLAGCGSNGTAVLANPVPVLNLVIQPPPLPPLSPVVPTSTLAGGIDFTLTVTGTGFLATSTVQWNGSVRSTTYVSNTQLTAAITAADIRFSGTASITVVNPVPGGGVSAAVPFFINVPSPRFTYALNRSGNGLNSGSTISIYAVDGFTGKLRPNGYAYLGQGANYTSMAVDPLGRFVYVANDLASGSVPAFLP